ncbi:MAG: hypothetical protein HY660_05355 [Armatimonadetes bacterium]|nr:hypothetical protein [Armatimonadota bacterium]
MIDPAVLRQIIESLDPAGPPRALFVRRAPGGISGAAEPRAGAAGGRLGVLSASFDPLTAAHARLVALARERCGLDEVMLLLTRVNVDKSTGIDDLVLRVEMLLTYAERRTECSVALCSHGRFVDKAAALRPCYPAQTARWFVMGYDTLVRLFDPRYYADRDADLGRLFATSRVLAANRGSPGEAEVRALLSRPENRAFADGVDYVPLDAWHARISATEVRWRVARGESIADLVPEEIAVFIEARGLYRGEQE